MIRNNGVTRVMADRIKTLSWVVFGSMVGLMIAASLVGTFGSVSPIEVVGGLLVLVILLASVSRMLFLLVMPTPLLVLEHKGVRLEPGLFGDQLIPWSQVQNVTIRQVKLGIGAFRWAPRYWLRFTVVSAADYRQWQNWVQRVLAYLWYSSYMVRGEAMLNSGITSASLEQVYRQMSAYTANR